MEAIKREEIIIGIYLGAFDSFFVVVEVVEVGAGVGVGVGVGTGAEVAAGGGDWGLIFLTENSIMT